jgi:hypothetical protein
MHETTIRKRRDLSARRERHFVVSGLAALGGALGATAAAGFSTAAAAAVGASAIGAAAGLGTLGYGIAAGESGKKAQQQALREQTQAQQEQAARAGMQQRRSEMAMAGAQRRQPNVAGIMAGAQEAAGGPTSTMLTGPMGVNPQDLNLGRSTLLGG